MIEGQRSALPKNLALGPGWTAPLQLKDAAESMQKMLHMFQKFSVCVRPHLNASEDAVQHVRLAA